MHLTAGTVLQDGKYKVDAVLGVGGFGITYRATHTYLGQAVALKTLNDSLCQHPNFDQFQHQFFTEAQWLALCQHPNIVRVLDFFEEAGLYFMVMDYIPGQTLAELVEPGKPLSEAEAMHYIRQIGSALKAVHQGGLLHRDVKPENIIRRSGTHLAMLVDFGIARDFTPGMRQTHTGLLSGGYAPLEQYFPSEQLTPATDIYALAATLYYLLTGEPPVAAPVRARVPMRDLREFQPNLSPEVEQAILRGLELEPRWRPQTVENWLALLPEPLTERATVHNRRSNSFKNRGGYLEGGFTDIREIVSYPADTQGEYAIEPAPQPLFPVLFLLTAAICGWMGFDLAQQYTATRTQTSHLSADRSFSSLDRWLKERVPNQSSPHLLFNAPSVESSPNLPLELPQEPKDSLDSSDSPPAELGADAEVSPKAPANPGGEAIQPEPETELPTELPPQQAKSYAPEPSPLAPEPAIEPEPAPVPEVIPPPILPNVPDAAPSPASPSADAQPLPEETLPRSEFAPPPQPESAPLYSAPVEGIEKAPPAEPTPATPSQELLEN